MKKTVSLNSDIGERELSLDILLRVSGGSFLNHAMEDAFRKYPELDDRKRSFIAALCDGVTRRRITLDHYIALFSRTAPGKIRPVIFEILRMGIYQLWFMDSVPDHAAVDESVKLAAGRGFGRLRGYVNGVLRNAARKGRSDDEPLHVRYSCPGWMAERFISWYGEEKAVLMMEESLGKPELTAWVLTGDISGVTQAISSAGVVCTPVQCIPDAVRISGGRPALLRPFKEGQIYYQDVASQLFSILCAGCLSKASGSLRILDVCAAPGGKALHVAVLLGSRASVLARDVSSAKTALIEENLSRLSLDNVKTQVFDATCQDDESCGKYDLVIADLPCSGLGVISRKPDLKYRVDEGQLSEVCAHQEKILDRCVQYVKPGGFLAYGTCTVNPAENGEHFGYLLQKPGFEAVSIEELLPAHFRGRTGDKGYLQLLQGVDVCDGFFMAFARRRDGVGH